METFVESLTPQRLAATALLVGWIFVLTYSKAWPQLLFGAEDSMLPKHHSFRQFAMDCAWFPLTLIILQFAAWNFANIRLNGRIVAFTLAVAAPFFLFMFVAGAAFVRAAIRVHEIHAQLASLQGRELQEVGADASLAGMARVTPTRQRIDWRDGSLLALSMTRQEKAQLVVWANQGASGAEAGDPRVYFPPFDSVKRGFEHEADTVAKAIRARDEDFVEQLRWVAVSDSGLTVASRPHRNLQDARQLVALGRELEQQLGHGNQQGTARL